MIFPSFVLAVAASSSMVTAMPLVRQLNQTIEWNACPDLNKNFSALNNATGSPFDCATLPVPLDYTNKSSIPLNLNLYRVNATRQPVLGSVLINPGGPGDPGGQSLALTASELAHYIGDQYNLISWDPRGSGQTIPFDCKLEPGQSQPQTTKRDTSPQVQGNLTNRLLNGGWENAVYQANKCAEVMAPTGRFVGTPFTVRDMMAIVDALGEDGMLRYWGTSYGTALGSYAAAMFPDRIERMVLDGNINPVDYQKGTYGDMVTDADNVFMGFLDECLKNKAECDLAKLFNATSADDMLKPVLEALHTYAAASSQNETAWKTYSGVVNQIFPKLYTPSLWPQLARNIALTLQGKPVSPESSTGTWSAGKDALTGIRASDAVFQVANASEYIPVAEYQSNVSKLFGSQYESIWTSAAWKMPAAEQYKGSFSNIQTKHPILYINGENDPVTPVVNAEQASKGFKGSVVLKNSPGYGHGIIAAPSTCVAAKTSQYFKNGTMPDVSQACKTDAGPWDIAKNHTLVAGGNTL